MEDIKRILVGRVQDVSASLATKKLDIEKIVEEIKGLEEDAKTLTKMLAVMNEKNDG